MTIATSAPAAAAKPAGAVATATLPVEILSKPRPLYTEEARRSRIEGEVLLEVLFAASGPARIVRVVRSLGHGLDETAMAAARDIRFRPAQRDGQPVDSSAVVHIVFQLAF
jgi:TonB family protein